ncbi:hypothetical protein Tco_1152745 [Tanacetum coccineum]
MSLSTQSTVAERRIVIGGYDVGIKEREEMEGQDEKEKKDREEGGELKLGAWSLYWSWMAAETPRVFRAVGQQ